MRERIFHAVFGLALGLFSATAALANPTGANIARGQVTFTNPNINTLNIRNSPGAIVNWQKFSIGAGQTTRFIQNSAASAILNRVTGQNPSALLGRLLSNGRVFLINRNGIVFGPNAVIDTAGLVASTLNITDQDFINQNLHFQGDSQSGSIDNQGYIKAGADGNIFLIAPNITNSGIIETHGGQLVLAAGESVSLVSLDSDNIVFDVQAPDHEVVNLGTLLTNGGAARMFAGTIRHSGTINADSVKVDAQGRVVLTASDDIYLQKGSSITASGTTNAAAGTITISAHSSQVDNNGTVYAQGEIRAEGDTGGDVSIDSDALLLTGHINVDGVVAGGNLAIHSGKRGLVTDQAVLSANASNGQGGRIKQQADESLFSSGNYSATGETGGRIDLLGDEVKLANAEVDVTGQHQGGDIRVGGGFKGTEAGITNAKTTQVNSTTTLTADAIESGTGGTVVVWADGQSRFSGTIRATGGAAGGDGGSAEVSGKTGLAYNGLVDLSANAGNPGSLLLDPKNITIDNGPAAGLALLELLDPNPNALDRFGSDGGVFLATGMLVVPETLDDIGANNAGAVYLFNPATGGLLAALIGARANDNVGTHITELSNGNYVVGSPNWDDGVVAADVGAVTWGNGTTGVSGTVSAGNSLVGSTTNDLIGSVVDAPGDGIVALSNGNYVVASPRWDNGTVVDAGAATWGNGLGGTVGVVDITNSLVGTTLNDGVGGITFQSRQVGVVALSNGNYVVGSQNWNNGVATRAGAATWGNGLSGTTGAVSASNSLVGTTLNDQVGSNRITALSNGNYVVASSLWDDGTTAGVGAATWGNGLGGTVGPVTSGNSLVGTTFADQVGDGSNASGSFGVTALSNGNYVVASTRWKGGGGALTAVGAATWGNGLGGTTGPVTTGNSLVGSTAFDTVATGVTALSNGNYVVASPSWNNGASRVGAATWGNGLGGTVGAVTAANSLVGSTVSDQVSDPDIIALSNGNYVVVSRIWNNGAAARAGAVTWGNGLGGTVGAVDATNSIVGSATDDQIGTILDPGRVNSVKALTNDNYVVVSTTWDSGATIDVGAVTWGNGLGGTVGVLNAANSLVGTTGSDSVGSSGIAVLSNGNYVVGSSSWRNGGIGAAGAATWGNGLGGTVGAVSAANSLVGSTSNDQVGGSITALSDDNYVVASPFWNDGVSVSDAGAVTPGNGTTGTIGPVSAANSLVGSTNTDQVGRDGVVDVGAGRYAVFSQLVNTGNGTDAGQVLVVDPSGGGVTGTFFSDVPGTDVFITNGSIEATLNTGTPLVLQANNDIIQSAGADIVTVAGGAGGDLTLQAGRSIIFNADITTDGGDFTAVANSTVADGVVDLQRDSGAAEILMADGTTLNTGAGNMTLEIGAGPTTNNTNGNITIENLSAAHIDLTLNGASANGSILRASPDALINGASLFVDHDPSGGPGGGSVGTLAEPLRVDVLNLAAHTHLASPGIFFDSVSTSVTTIGNTFFGNLHLIQGLETVAGGDIVVNAIAGLTVQKDIKLAGSRLTLTAPAISLDAIVDAGTGTVQLSSTGSVTQSAAITAGMLELLGVGGVHTLTHAGNQVAEVRMNTGSVILTNNGTLTVNGILAPGAGPETVLTAATPMASDQLGTSIDVDGDVMVVGAPGVFISGQGAAYVYRWDGANWVYEAKLSVPGTQNFGRSVTVEGNRIVVGAPETTNGFSRAGAAYPFEWNGTNWVQGSLIPFTEKVFESEFGSAVAIDNNRLVVGGLGRTSEGGFWTGKIWFYELISGLWVEQGNARQGDPQSNDYFGASLDISGDKLIVGAPNGPASGTPGKAYIFDYNPVSKLWAQTAKLVQSEGVTLDFFAQSVSISNDIAVVGADRADPSGKVDAGSLYVFRESGGSWTVEQVLEPVDQVLGDRFGTASRVRDGMIVATSTRADLPGNTDAGAGYLFKFNGTTWEQSSKITAAAPAASDWLGFSAALADQRIFFGALFADPGGQASAGAAHVFDPKDSGSTLASGLTITSTDDLLVASSVTSVSGGIDLHSANNITVIDDLLALGSTLTLEAGTDGTGDLLFDAEAAFVDPDSDSTINVFTGSTAGNTGNATLSGENIIFRGASTDPGTSTIDFRLRGSGTLDIDAIGGDILIESGTGGIAGLDIINIISGDLTVAAGAGGPMNLTAFSNFLVDSQAAGGQQLQALIQAHNGKQTLEAGVDITLNAGPAAGSSIDIEATGGVTAGLQQELLLNQDDDTGEGLLLMKAGGGLDNRVVINAKTGHQLFDIVGDQSGIGMQTDGSAGTGTGMVQIVAGGDQTLLVTGDNNVAVLAGNIPVEISAVGAQVITIDDGGLNISSSGNEAAKVSGASQDIDATFLQIISSGTGGGNATVTAIGGTQDITTTNGLDNSIFILAGSGDFASLEAPAGNQIITTNGGIRVLGGGGASGNALVQAQTGQTIGALFIDVIGGAGDAIIDTNAGVQNIDTTGLNSAAGANVGVNEGILIDAAGAGVAAIHSDGTQDISVINSDLVRVVATVGNADVTSAGTQVLSVTGSGANAIEVGDIAGGLTSGFSLIGGNQTITAGTGAEMGSISIRAGTSGSADSRITSTAAQTISTTGNFTMTGGSGTFADADVEATSGLLDLDVGGNLVMTGGTGPSSEAEINVQSLDALVGGDMSLTGGSNTNTDADILVDFDTTVNVGGSLTLTGGTVSADVEITSGGDLFVTTGTDLILTGGSGDGAGAFLDATGVLDLTVGNDLNLTSGSAPNTDANISSSDDIVTANVTGAVNLIGGLGLDSDVELQSDSDDLTLVSGGSVTITGGGGDGAFAEIIADGLLDITVGGDLNLTGGAGMDSDATVESDSGAILANITGGVNMIAGSGIDSDVEFEADTAFTLTTGTNLTLDANPGGADSYVLLGMTAADIATFASPLSITTGTDVLLRGGTQASTDVDIQGATTRLDIGGNLTLTGGSGPDSAAEIDDATLIEIDVGGSVQLTGGSNTDSAAVIGDSTAAANVILGRNAPVGGAITLTGGTHVEGLAAIGTTCAAGPCPATVTINGGSDVILTSNVGEAFIGSLTQDAGAVIVKAGLSGAGFPGLFGSGRIMVDGPITLEALLGNAFINLFGELDSGFGTLTATSQNDLDLGDLSGGRLVLKSIAGDIEVFASKTVLARAVGLAPGTRAIDIQAPAGDVIMDLDATGDDVATVSGGIFISAADELELDDGDQDVIYRTPGDLTLISTSGEVEAEASADLFGRNITISAATWVDTGRDITATGFVDIDAATGSVDMDDIVAALDIDILADGNVDIGTVSTTGGALAFTSATGAVVLNLPATTGDVALELNANAFTLTTAGAGVDLTSNIGVMLSQTDIAGVGGDFSLSAPTLTLGSALDFANGGATLISSNGIQVDQGISALTFLDLRAGSGTLDIDGVDVMAGTDLNLSGLDVLLGGGATYKVDAGNELTVNASGNFLFSGIDSTASEDADLIAGTRITIKAANAIIEGGDGSNTPATVTAPLVQFNLSGDLTVRGGASTFSGAKVDGLNQVDVNANNVFIQGTLDSSSAGIDPLVINMNLTGGLSLSAGSGQNADAFIIGDTVNINTLGDVTVTGGTNLSNAGIAFIESQTGNLTINTGIPTLANPVPGNVTLIQGTGANADAVLVANFGSGQVNITAGNCTNCNVLGLDPFSDPASQAGIFGSLVFNLVPAFVPAFVPPVVLQDTNTNPDVINQIITMDEFLDMALEELQKEDEDDADGRVLMCR